MEHTKLDARIAEIEARNNRDAAYDMPRLYVHIDRVDLWRLAKTAPREDIAELLAEVARLQSVSDARQGVLKGVVDGYEQINARLEAEVKILKEKLNERS